MLFFAVLMALGAAAYWQWGTAAIMVSYRVETSGKNLNRLDEVSFWEITSGRLLKYLELMDKERRLPGVPAGAGRLVLKRTGANFLEETGFSLIDVASPVPAIRPYTFAGFFKTHIKKSAYILLVQKWLNPDGSTAFLLLLAPLEGNIDESGALHPKYLALLEQADVFLAPYIAFAREDSCTKNIGLAPDYCSWFNKHRKRLESIVNRWLDTGSLPFEAGKTPFIFRDIGFSVAKNRE